MGDPYGGRGIGLSYPSLGRVYLVGAGPGDPELLTLRAVRILRQADVVLHDRLIHPAVLDLAPQAEWIDVGRAPGQSVEAYHRTLMLMLQHARAGRTVVRLKGGDPMVFGRGAEEWAFLVAHGIPVEVVPGVSSAIALPALAGIPLTHRDLSHGFAVVAGHTATGEPDWSRYAAVDTLVILMGVEARRRIAQRLIEAGRPPQEPVAFIERGTWPEERVCVATLDQVAHGNVEVRPPAVWVIGAVVTLRAILCPEVSPCPLPQRTSGG